MSQWGKLDRIEQTSTANANTGSTLVVSGRNAFTEANSFFVGYGIVIANVDYTIASIANVGNLFLDTAYTGANTITGNIAVQQTPKGLRTNGLGIARPFTANIRTVFGVDREEVSAATNKSNSISHTGWVSYKSYITSQGSLRNKSEVLVAMSKNFNTDVNNVLQTDANDDLIIFDTSIFFSLQPVTVVLANINSATSFTVIANTTGNTKVVTFLWKRSTDGITFTDFANVVANVSGNTTATLAIANVFAYQNNYVRVVASANGAISATSDAAQITFV